MNWTNDQALVWKHTHTFKHEYGLHLGSQIIGKIYWPKFSGRQAIGEIANESWTFERKGILKPKTIILKTNTNEQVATYETATWTGKGFLILNNSQSYQWVNTHSWRGEWCWQELYGTTIITFKPKNRWFAVDWLVTPEPTAANLNFLMVLGFYLILRQQENS